MGDGARKAIVVRNMATGRHIGTGRTVMVMRVRRVIAKGMSIDGTRIVTPGTGIMRVADMVLCGRDGKRSGAACSGSGRGDTRIMPGTIDTSPDGIGMGIMPRSRDIGIMGGSSLADITGGITLGTIAGTRGTRGNTISAAIVIIEHMGITEGDITLIGITMRDDMVTGTTGAGIGTGSGGMRDFIGIMTGTRIAGRDDIIAMMTDIRIVNRAGMTGTIAIEGSRK